MKGGLFIILALIFTSNIHAQSNNYNLGTDEQLLDGISFNYQYQNQTAIHIKFENNRLKYKWILGPNKGKSERIYPYKSRQLDSGIYLVNWQEPKLKNFITLVFNFNTYTVSSSVIVKYGEEEQFTTFDAGFISHMRRENN